MNYLQNIDSKLLLTSFPIVHYKVGVVPIEISSKFLPVLEGPLAVEPFLQKTPDEIMQSDNFHTDINLMTGFTTSESLFFTKQNFDDPKTLDAFNKDFEIQLPSTKFNKLYKLDKCTEALAKIRKFYFNDVPVNYNISTLIEYKMLISDIFQVYPNHVRIRNYLKKTNGSIYFYVFDLVTKFNIYRQLKNIPLNVPGAVHADDLCYIFRCRIIPTMYDRNLTHLPDYLYIEFMTNLYTNFAYYGEPKYLQFDFKAVTKDAFNYLYVTQDGEGVRMGTDPYGPTIQFYDNIIRDYPECFE